jgi:hypothetical protein
MILVAFDNDYLIENIIFDTVLNIISIAKAYSNKELWQLRSAVSVELKNC